MRDADWLDFVEERIAEVPTIETVQDAKEFVRKICDRFVTDVAETAYISQYIGTESAAGIAALERVRTQTLWLIQAHLEVWRVDVEFTEKTIRRAWQLFNDCCHLLDANNTYRLQ
jgi:hypothetical protein